MALSAEKFRSFANALMDDVDSGEQFPNVRPLLAHYTSASTFEKLIKNDEIWFSNPLNMTDVNELRHGMNEGAEQFRSSSHLIEACADAEIHNRLMVFHDRYFRWFDEKHAIDTYVLCTTQHDQGDNDGALSMWRGYGADGAGVALVFDTHELTPHENSPFIVGKVAYKSHAALQDWIDEKLQSLGNAIQESAKTDDDLESAACAWIERLKLFSLFTKHDGFREEREWRIVYMPERDVSGLAKSMLGYHISSRGFETKLKLKFGHLSGLLGDELSLEKLLDRIILGPSISSVLSEGSARRMLQLEGRQDLAPLVTSSSIPYRPRGSAA